MAALDDKVALVTGGATRIGRVIARRLAAEGCDIVIHYRNSEQSATALADELRGIGRQAWLVSGDLADDGVPSDVMKAAWDLAGWVDIAVNNASSYSRETFAESTQEDYDLHWKVNALAPILMAKTFSECISQSEILPNDFCGRIINILDARIAKPEPGALPYWLSKKALASFTEGGAAALAPRITVNGVAPGPALTPAVISPNGDPAGAAPLERDCTPEDIAAAVLSLATSPAVTGQILYVDSGRHLS